MEIKGKITHVLEPITGTSDKGEWKKQTFVLLTEDTYPKSIAFDVFNDKVTAPKLNDEVTVSINLESREYGGKWYTNVGAWKIESANLNYVNSNYNPNASGGNGEEIPNKGQRNPPEPMETDDLPF